MPRIFKLLVNVVIITKSYVLDHFLILSIYELYGSVHKISVLIETAIRDCTGETTRMYIDSPEPWLFAYTMYECK